MTADADEMLRALKAELLAKRTGNPVMTKKEEITEKA